MMERCWDPGYGGFCSRTWVRRANWLATHSAANATARHYCFLLLATNLTHLWTRRQGSIGPPDLVGPFLADVGTPRKRSIATRNQRLAAIHALARFVGEHSPEHIAWCGQIRSIPFKKANKAVIPYLEKPEMDALLRAPDRQTVQGRRDHALLLFLY